jgi:putative ABC transport system ATP-binding protein
LIRVQSVNRHFTNTAGVIRALEDINLTIAEGEYVSVVGRSGSGKSTLMNMITGIDHPSSGDVIIGEVNTRLLSENEMAAWRCRNLGIVFQFYQLIPVLTVLDNTLLPMQLLQDDPADAHHQRAEQLLRTVDLWEKKNRFPAQLSGGEQQRAALARALANNPAILIADEPTGNLSTAEAEQVMAVFAQTVSQGRTVIYVTHDLDLAAKARRTITLSDGCMVKDEIRTRKMNGR